MKHKIALITLVLLITAGCTNKPEERPSIFLNTTCLESTHPAFLKIEQGTAAVISEADYREQLADCKDMLLPLADSNDANTLFVTQVQQLYDMELARRVSPIFVKEDIGGGMDAVASVQLKRSVKSAEALSPTQEETIFRAIEERFELSASGVSGMTQSGLFISDEEKEYVALVFVPCVYRITGELIQGEAHLKFEALYPCVNAAGYLDGIFAVAASDFAETFVDAAEK